MSKTAAQTGHETVYRLLLNHPEVEVSFVPGVNGIAFGDRTVVVCPQDALLVELSDNNPLVCADKVTVPDPAGTLALIALGPLIRAGLINTEPSLLFSFPVDDQVVRQSLQGFGLGGEISLVDNPEGRGPVLALTAMVEIPAADIGPEGCLLDVLYEEAYGRSFFVSRSEEGDWNPESVRNQPQALFRLRMTEYEPNSLLTIMVMADENGKCGAAQLVHVMNVMCGFEESLGIA